MSLTQEEVNKMIAEECIKSAEGSLHGEDEHRTKMKLEAFEKHQRDLQIIQSYAFKKDYAKRATYEVIRILKKHKEKEDLTWYPEDRRYEVDFKDDYKVPGIPRETILERYSCPGKDSYDKVVGLKPWNSGIVK